MESQRITEEAINIKEYINDKWPYFEVNLERRLSELFPEPSNVGLKHIWKYGSADLSIFLKDELIAVIEPGGSHHFNDERQVKNDRRKWKLCDINGVNCLFILNGVLNRLSNRRRRSLIGRYLFGVK